MNICHVSYNYYGGISSSALLEYSREEAAQGLEVSIISLGQGIDGIAEEYIFGTHVYKIPSNSISARSIQKKRVISEMVKIIKGIDCDLIHIYSSIGLGLLPLLVHDKNKVWLYDIRSGPITPGLPSVIGWKLLRLETKLMDGVAIISQGAKQELYGKDRADVPIFSLGVNFDLFKKNTHLELRSILKLDPSAQFLIYTGAFHPTRNLDVLLEMMAILIHKNKRSVQLLMIGDGTDLTRLKQKAVDLGVDRSVHFLGRIPYLSIPDYLSAADIGLGFVPNTPSYSHMPALKTIEMLACELPVIATNTEGNRQFIQNYHNGLLVCDNPESISAAVIQLLDDDQLRFKLSTTARNSVVAYSYSEIVKSIVIPYYEFLINQKKYRITKNHAQKL